MEVFTLLQAPRTSGTPILRILYRVTLTVDTSGIPGYLTGQGKTGPFYIDAVAVKVSSEVISAILVDAPDASGNQGGQSNWQIVPGGLNANGCSGAGSGFECADWMTLGSFGVPVETDDNLLSWTFEITVAAGQFFGFEGTTDDPASIKMRFLDGSGKKVDKLLSENIWIQEPLVPPPTGPDDPPPTGGDNPVPEPGVLSLLVAGVLGLRATIRRRKV
ncbi:PEP-CTERM domain protein [Methylocaldum szegediense]|uniref:PEP-CTERM protein-sorting domain-containing protein n=1 Tax=Methylocaldum szegediense TaxID=73780 RepID=A0ABM9I1J0_9GAMM|nr:PEP-CTERM domain protein [Methylocaldum szegediense]CAI8829423.1 protein of unknown function [Methylocaldum szegediense]